MSKLIPDYVFESIYDITPQLLRENHVRSVLIDLDGTMASHKAALPPDSLAPFVRALRDAGMKVLVFSNNRAARVEKFCAALGVDFISRAGKPFSGGFQRAAERLGVPLSQTAVVGDQIFTDTLGANNAGVVPMLVEPIRLAGNPGRYLRYAAETPFRLLGKRRPFL